jgi:endonuclease/exonuclease/phosphatase family metal-dependent hydrolase
MKYVLYALSAFVFFVSSAAGADFRVCTYSLLNYSTENEDGRTPRFKMIIDSLQPDILVVQDIAEQDAAFNFFTGALDPHTWSLSGFNDGPGTDNMLYFKIDDLSFLDVKYHPTALRDIAEYRLWIKSTGDTLYIFSVHLTTGDNAEDETARMAEVQVLQSRLLEVVSENPLAKIFVCGNYNFYRMEEPGYMRLMLSATSVLADPLNGWVRNDETNAKFYTQSTRTAADGACGGGATGGLDDRFDMILFNYIMQEYYVADSYTAFGNDGQSRLNSSINNPPNTLVSPELAEALRCASDHLPVFADFVFSESVPVREQELVSTPLRIYPMPASAGSVLEVSLPESTAFSVIIADMFGRTVHTVSGVGRHTFPLPELAPGVYVCRVEGQPALSSTFVVVR